VELVTEGNEANEASKPKLRLKTGLLADLKNSVVRPPRPSVPLRN